MASRFQFDMHRDRDGWTRIGGIDVTTTAATVAASVIAMIVWAVSPGTVGHLAFYPPAVRGGEVWRLATWPLANAPDIFVIITLAFFWFVGHIVEDLLGKHRYLILLVILTVVPAALVTALPSAQFPTTARFGLGLLGAALFVVFAAEYPTMPFFFGIPAWVLAAVFVVLDLLQLTGRRWWGSVIHLLLMVALGPVVVRQWGFASRLQMIPRLARPRSSHHPSRRPSRATGRGTVVSGPWTPPPTPADNAAAHAELDELLDKISDHGLASLTDAEKRRLNELSKKLR